jgi:hypothetical protein
MSVRAVASYHHRRGARSRRRPGRAAELSTFARWPGASIGGDTTEKGAGLEPKSVRALAPFTQSSLAPPESVDF